MSMKKTVIIGFLTFLLGIIITASVCYFIYSNQLTTFKTTTANNELGNYMKGAFDWLEDSGEAESLEYQAYNSATTSLNKIVQEPSAKPKAVILDIDETCLNNAPFQGYELLNADDGFSYSTWDKWVNYSEATAIPGSVQFTQQAAKDGVQIFYVSGRAQSELAATEKNMVKLGFAQANESGHIVLLPPNQGSKQPTYNEIEQKYNVVMYIGDQLTDMGSIFSGNSAEEKKQVAEHAQDWGSKYIAIPDPLYGNYIGALDNDKKLSNSEQAKVYNDNIQTFSPKTGKVYYNKL